MTDPSDRVSTKIWSCVSTKTCEKADWLYVKNKIHPPVHIRAMVAAILYQEIFVPARNGSADGASFSSSRAVKRCQARFSSTTVRDASFSLVSHISRRLLYSFS